MVSQSSLSGEILPWRLPMQLSVDCLLGDCVRQTPALLRQVLATAAEEENKSRFQVGSLAYVTRVRCAP